MYFQKLEMLNKFNDFNEKELNKFDEILKLIYEKNYWIRFNPRVYKYFNLSVDEDKWISALEKLELLDLLQINFEICCFECGETIEIVHEYEQIPFNKETYCEISDTSFEISDSDIFITYKFESSLINSFSKKKR